MTRSTDTAPRAERPLRRFARVGRVVPIALVQVLGTVAASRWSPGPPGPWGRSGGPEQFADRAGAFLVPNETRRQHLGIVDDQQVPGLQKAGKVTEYSMTELAAGAAEAQQARGISWFTWLLGNQFFGQVKIKVAFLHRSGLLFIDITLCG